jgi:hypothetical protein
MISNRNKNKRRYRKELKSFRNKLGSNIIWFDSLPKEKQYDLLFEWKKYRHSKKDIKIKEISVKRFDPVLRRYKRVDIKIYPPKLKYWILEKRFSGHYTPNKLYLRDKAIDFILN